MRKKDTNTLSRILLLTVTKSGYTVCASRRNYVKYRLHITNNWLMLLPKLKTNNKLNTLFRSRWSCSDSVCVTN